MSSLVKRVLAAVVAIPILLAVVFGAPSGVFDAVAAAALLWALHELYRMADHGPMKPMPLPGFLSATLILASVPAEKYGFGAREANGLSLILVGLSYLASGRSLKPAMGSLAVTGFGAFYVGVLGSYLLLLRRLVDGPWILLFLFVATWAVDTGGYFAGKSLGRHKMSPLVSPNKTWEGLAGGFVMCALALAALSVWAPVVRAWGLGPVALALLALLFTLGGQVGDLVESLMKRSLDVKDSGSVLPGHGGMLDRIDSLLFNAPLLYLFMEVWARLKA